MNIKKNDNVKILAGKDRGKTGKVLQVFTNEKKASVEGINIAVKHLRPRKQGEAGQRLEFPAPMNMSNLMLVCPKCGRPTRVGYKFTEPKTAGEKKTKYRICKKCSEAIA